MTYGAGQGGPSVVAAGQTRTPWLAHTCRALRHRSFRLFWFGQVISQTGVWMQIVAQGWLVYRLTDSPLLLGLVNVVGLVPVVPLSLLSGLVTDRFPRRRLIVAAEATLMVQALAMAGLAGLGLIRVWHIVALSFVLGAAAAIEQPVRLAFIADTVGREDLTNAVALNAAAYNSARIVGPAVAGLLVAQIGEAGCFLVNGVTYLAVIGALLAMRLPPAPHREQGSLQIAASLRRGLQYMWRTDAIRGLMALTAVFAFFALPYLTLLPAFVGDALQVGPEGLGWLMTALGVGAIVGAMGVASIGPGRRGMWLAAGAFVAPLVLLLFSASRSLWLSLILAILLGGSNAVRQTLSNGLVQQVAGDEYQGRVVSAYNLLLNGMSRVGALGIGGLAQVTGIAVALSLGAAASLAWAVIMVWRMPYVHRLS